MCVCDALPPPIVPVLHRFVQHLRDHLTAHQNAPLADHEEGLLAAWRTEAGALLSAVVAAATTGANPAERPPRSACPTCGISRPAERWRERQVQTQLGPLQLRRTLYVCAACGQRWSRADRTLGLAPHQQTSARLSAWQARLAGLTTFREATALLAELSGVTVGVETLRTQAERQGAALEEAQQAQAQHVRRTEEPLPGTAEPAPGHLVVETDGVFVRYRHPTCAPTRSGWHEVKLGIVGGWTGAPPDAVLQNPSYVAAREEAEPFATRLATEAARRGALDVVGWEQPPGTDPRLQGVGGPSLAVLRSAVVLGDGAAWIWHTVAPQVATERTEVVDWFHGSEHLWELSKTLWGDPSPIGSAWAKRAVAVLWDKGATGLLPLLGAVAAPTEAGAEALTREQGYFQRNAARMRYPTFRQQGLPIGSGAVESSAKYLVQQRMKRAGMRWSEAGAHAILQLRCQSLTEAARTGPRHHAHARSAKAA